MKRTHRIGVEEERNRGHLRCRFELPDKRDCNGSRFTDQCHPLAERRDGDFAPNDDERSDGVRPIEVDEHDERCRDHQLVGNRVKKSAKRRLLLQTPREKTVEPVGDARGNEEHRREEIRPLRFHPARGKIEEEDDERYRSDSQTGQRVGPIPPHRIHLLPLDRLSGATEEPPNRLVQVTRQYHDLGVAGVGDLGKGGDIFFPQQIADCGVVGRRLGNPPDCLG